MNNDALSTAWMPKRLRCRPPQQIRRPARMRPQASTDDLVDLLRSNPRATQPDVRHARQLRHAVEQAARNPLANSTRPAVPRRTRCC